MDIEQLKLITETLSSLGAEAKTVAIWWMVLDKVLPLIATVTSIWLVGTISVRVIIACSSADRAMRQLRDLLRTGPGGHLTLQEIDATVAEVVRLKNAEESK